MAFYQLDKPITVYRQQFEKYVLEIFGDHRISRESLDLEGLMFRIKYVIRKKGYNDEVEDLLIQYTEISTEMRNNFSRVVVNIIQNKIIKADDLVDVLTYDVNFDPNYVKFTMKLVSTSQEWLEKIDNAIDSHEVYNLYPGEYFRFSTDSYNDGIAKAYPELFKDNHIDIGKGDDGSVFCHSFTFQTSEACSLSCHYCLGAGTQILMADKTYKNIEDIKLGDMVMGFDEDDYEDEPASDFYPVKVTALFLRRSNCFKMSSKEFTGDILITPDHLVYTDLDEWTPVDELDKTVPVMVYDERGFFRQIWNYSVKRKHTNTMDVYNIETDSHTYVANNLCVHNCYQFNKSNMKMNFDTAKEFIDHLLNDDYGYINRHNSPAIILEFIGGEPLLEISLTRKIYEYFLDRCYELNHPWFTLHRLSICSNGMQYFDDEVQEFFKLYAANISFNISIDGNKELHDSCRVQPNGEGSYDIDMAALNHFNKHYTPERNSKMTLSPQNITYLYDSVIDFIKNDMKVININCVFEEGWKPEHAREEYYQLKKLADYLIDNNLDSIYVAIFNERQEEQLGKDYDGTSCGGSGSMLAIRPNGEFYPCLRYMPSSIGDDNNSMCIGTVKDGMVGREQDSEILKMLDGITRRSQTTDICWSCPIASDCMCCIALSSTVYGTPTKRTTFACIMMIAEALANVYYWNRLLLKHPDWNLQVRENHVPLEWQRIVLPEDEIAELGLLEATATIKKNFE